MPPVTDTFLLHLAEISATLTGLFLVGVFFYIDSELRRSRTAGEDVDTYMRAGTRIVLILYAIPLAVSLTLVGLDVPWARWVFALLCAILVAANIDTLKQIRTIARQTSSLALVANEVVSTVAVIVLVSMPWLLGGIRPSADQLAPSILLSLSAGFLSTCALVMAVFDLRRTHPAADTAPVRLIPHAPTDGVYAATPDYTHAIELRGAKRLLFVAGTMGLDPDGIPGESLDIQLELIWSNLRAILATAGMTVENIVRVTSYLRDPAYAEANAAARVAALNGRPVPTTAIIAETLDNGWLVEVEVIAAA